MQKFMPALFLVAVIVAIAGAFYASHIGHEMSDDTSQSVAEFLAIIPGPSLRDDESASHDCEQLQLWSQSVTASLYMGKDERAALAACDSGAGL